MSRAVMSIRGLGTQTACEACGTPIWFARHAVTGRVIPLDAASSEEGTFRPLPASDPRRARGPGVPADDVPKVESVKPPPAGMAALPGLEDPDFDDRPRYRSHFGTCTDPARFRKAVAS